MNEQINTVIKDAEKICVEIKEVEKTAAEPKPKNFDVPDLVAIYNIAKA